MYKDCVLETPPKDLPPPRTSAKVLIIDDDRAATAIVAARLARHFEVVSTNDPTRAVDLARDEMPHIILCDINMPEMTGDEVTHALSLDPLTHDIPVIYLTSLLERGDTEVLDGTFGGHYGVSKSASLVELLQVIAKVMQ